MTREAGESQQRAHFSRLVGALFCRWTPLLIQNNTVFGYRGQGARYLCTKTKSLFIPLTNERKISGHFSLENHIWSLVLREQTGTVAFHVPSSPQDMVCDPRRTLPQRQVNTALPLTLLLCSSSWSFALGRTISGHSMSSQRGTSLDHRPAMHNQFSKRCTLYQMLSSPPVPYLPAPWVSFNYHDSFRAVIRAANESDSQLPADTKIYAGRRCNGKKNVDPGRRFVDKSAVSRERLRINREWGKEFNSTHRCIGNWELWRRRVCTHLDTRTRPSDPS